ncbi:MAG: ABC transporter ATP-binding protein [Aggregatilineales bacterium]
MGMMGGMMGGRGGVLDRDVSKPKNLFSTLGRLAAYFGPYWPFVIVVLVLVFASAWAQVTQPGLVQDAVDCYLSPSSACTFAAIPQNTPGMAAMTFDDKAAGLAVIVLQLIALFIGGSIAGGLSFFTFSWTGQHVLRQLREDILKQGHRLSLSYYAEHEAGDLMSRVTSDIDTINQVLSFALMNVISGVVVVVWVVIKMLQANATYAVISFVMLPVMVFATVWLSNQARREFRKSRKEMGNVNAELQEGISGVREVQAFNREDENISRFRETNAANRDVNVRAVSYSSALAPTLNALSYVGLAVVACTGGLALLGNSTFVSLFGGAISIGLVFAFFAYTQRFSQPVQQIAVLWTNIQSAIAGSERIFGILDVKPEIVDKPGAIDMPPIRGNVEFDNAKAEYQKGVPVLRGINLSAKAGQTVAIVGPTGAGKTTIVNLIPRFYDVSSGSVKIDGIDVRDVKAATLRRQIGIVLQDSFLFSDTVMNNIRYGRPEATDEEVIEAAKLASADTFVERLPEKYETILGERGSGLSQGQRQLLSIARAALANPRLLILDEATSSVDTRTERLIQKALEKLLHGRTSFVIAHRLSTIRHADLVLMLSGGEIIERGTFNELLAQKGAFYDLYMSQFQGKEEPESAPANGGIAPAAQGA